MEPQASNRFPYNVYNNPYRAKRLWPPDFEQLPSKYQFRLERKYRRRAKLKWARPQWMAYTKIAQWTIPIGIISYAVLFMEWNSEEGQRSPVSGVRNAYKKLANSLYTFSSSEAATMIPEASINTVKPTKKSPD